MQNTTRTLPKRPGLGRRLRSRAAFTLVEVMIAFTILIAGLCGGLATIQSGLKSIDSARCSTLAAQIMQSQIERLRLLNWTDLSGNIGENRDVSVTGLVPVSANDIAGRFKLTQTILTDTSRTGIINIQLNVTWTNIGGVVQNRSFVTRYAKNGLYDYYFSRH